MPSIISLLKRFNLVKQIPVFQKLNWLELRSIAKKSIVEEYRKGQVIRRQGDPADYFYCLSSGRIQSFTLNYIGKKENIDYIHRGMHFGIISTLTGESHSMNYEAMNDSVVVKISREDFHSILKAIPSLGIEFSHVLSRRVRSHVQGKKSYFESNIISIYSPLKGTGSSTYAANLALSLEHETKKKVLLVSIQHKEDYINDQLPIDLQRSSSIPRVINLRDIDGDFEKIFRNITKGELKIDILKVIFDDSEGEARKQISPLVSTLVGDYHYVIVDLPNDMDDFVFETLTQSDEVHLVAVDRRKDLESISSVIDRLQTVFKDRFHEEKIHVILRAARDEVFRSNEEIHQAIHFNVHVVLPHVDGNDLVQMEECKSMVILRAEEHTEYAKIVKRLARQIGGVMVGLVLGGGAALGVAHVGVIRVLEEENIPIDIVVGSSMGALIGSLWVTGRDSHGLEKVAREFEHWTGMGKLIDPCNPFKGLTGGLAIQRWLKGHLGNQTFNEVKIPFKAVAYDLYRREEIVIDSGSLVEAVRRSIAIPGVIMPITNKDQMIIDGGVLNPLPTNVLVNMGIKKIIAVNVLQSPEDSSEGFDILQHKAKELESLTFTKNPFKFMSYQFGKAVSKIFTPNIADIIVRTLQASEYVIAMESAKSADVVIHPDLVGINWFELYKVDALIKSGEQSARDLLPKIKKLIDS